MKKLWLVPAIAVSLMAHAASPLAGLVEQAARQELLIQAQQAGLMSPTIWIELRSQATQAPPVACHSPVEVQAVDTRFVTRMRFSAVCNDTPGWQAEYIVRGTIEADVIVAAASITAGRPIDPDQLERVRRDASGTAGALSNPDEVVGKASQRPLHRGQLIDKRWLIEPVLVQRGATVTIVAHNTGVEVRAVGGALDQGRRNDIVRVRNTLNGQVLRARVIGDNTVEPADSPAP